MFRKNSLFLAIVLISNLSIAAQSNGGGDITPEMRQAADKAYQAKNWHEASEAYRAIVNREEKNVGARYRLGISLLGIAKDQDAAEHLQIANQLSPNAVFALALARAYARLRNSVKLYEVLENIPKMGGVSAETLNAELDFKDVRSEARFIEAVKKCDLAFNPCKGKAENRQFDFWIGEWDAKNVQGLTVASSSIQLILGNCVIFENWNTPVSSGKSFSNYNSADGKWHQTWVDDKGTLAYYVGGLVDGKMVLDNERVVNGKKTIGRMTFSKLPNGYVRQHGESSTDDGKTWTTTFDFAYVRKK